MPISVFGLASTDVQFKVVVETLKTAGFIQDDISVLFPYRRGSQNSAMAKKANGTRGSTAGETTNRVLGCAPCSMMDISVVAIPGVGPFFAAGPILVVLSGIMIGAAIGGFTGILMGLGLTDNEAKCFDQKIRDGFFLVTIHAHNKAWAGKARTIFEVAKLEDVGSSKDAVTSAVMPAYKQLTKSRIAVA